MKCCADCDNAIFDEKWGEYKCKVVQHKVSFPKTYVACKDYKKKQTKNEADVEKT